MSILRIRSIGLAAAALAAAGGAGPCAAEDLANPFARPEAVAAPPAAALAGELDGYELTGIASLGGVTQVGLTDRASRRTRWLIVGVAADGLLAAEFDPARDAVRVESGAASRWIAMRQVSIQPLSLPRRDDGSIDWAHMRMTDKQKAAEAEAMLTDILEVGRLARLGQLKGAP